uniref:ClpX-type ZB domain-containing protein n=1 Tax=uncultured Nocardioidaceae bacterium TaxID=253824 RepID=A0A6J4LBU5_9ACTN|nr:MAG: hypothetical protein AVDCRST_MAG46-1311 [uncultured Nocardioidaceae bacterium]
MAPDALTCDHCGAVAPGQGLPLTWGTSQERGRTLHLCERCVRDNVRAIESKLDSEWW